MSRFLIQIICFSLLGIFCSGCIGYTVKGFSYPTSEYIYKKQDYPVKGWQDMPIIDVEQVDEPYQKVARIIITGNENASEKKLLRKMKKLAGRYDADAVIFLDSRIVTRESFDGISATLNIISIFDDSAETCDDVYLDTGGIYEAWEFEGMAIKFLEDFNED